VHEKKRFNGGPVGLEVYTKFLLDQNESFVLPASKGSYKSSLKKTISKIIL